MKPELRFETKVIRAADLGEQSSIPDLLGEQILQNQLEFALDEDAEIYEGYGRRANAYPYRQYNCYTRELRPREIRTAVLENRYMKAVFLPEYGGRLWELWDKENERNLLYTNDVLQFGNLAVRNAWFSGGVEWNIGIIGHTPFTADCLYTSRLQDTEGNPVLRIYEYERIREVTYQMDFWLEPDGRFLNCRMRIVNEGCEVVPMYWWSNIAVPEHEGGRIIVPAEQAYTNTEQTVRKVGIPMVEGTDVTDYRKIKRSVDYFFDIPESSPKYVANVDGSGCGLLQISTGRMRSRKLFSWGNQEASDRWQEFLTDRAGRYLEIQAGLGKTQYGCIPMAPHTAWEWMEQYGAVQVPLEILHKEHRERYSFLTEEILRDDLPAKLEQKLKDTKKMAKKQAELVIAGSGYGAMAKRNRSTKHLEFRMNGESLKLWQRFFETGVLHCPAPMDRPDEFMCSEKNTSFFEAHMKENSDNWYAHYQLGLGYFAGESYEKAKTSFGRSLALAENPWALHGLACTCLILNEIKEAARYMAQGIQMAITDVSYLKEGFKILLFCREYERICSIYEQLGDSFKNIGKLKYYYISALHALGEDKKAYGLLEENGGLVVEDIREGEDSVAQLWDELYQSVYGKRGKVPYKYNFRAF